MSAIITGDDLIQTFHAYDRWADEALIASLASVPHEDATINRLVAHIAAAEEIWLSRILATPNPPKDRFPSTPLPEAIKRLRANNAAFAAILAGDLDRILDYKDTMGNSWTSPLRDIIIHIANHATYHRGQIATAIKNAGGQPAVTDFIAWRRDLKPTA